jgi:hypothetical protein
MTTMTSQEKAAVIKLVGKCGASDIAVFAVTETDGESAKDALNNVKAMIAKKKADYAIVVLRK